MSKLFYDHLVIIEEVEISLRQKRLAPEEKQEIEKLIDEMIHHRVLGCILDNLPREHHEEFLERFHNAPYDLQLLDFINEKIEADIQTLIKEQIKHLEKELLSELKAR